MGDENKQLHLDHTRPLCCSSNFCIRHNEFKVIHILKEMCFFVWSKAIAAMLLILQFNNEFILIQLWTVEKNGKNGNLFKRKNAYYCSARLSFSIWNRRIKVKIGSIYKLIAKNNNESGKGERNKSKKWKIQQNGKWWKGFKSFPMIFFSSLESNQLLYTKHNFLSDFQLLLYIFFHSLLFFVILIFVFLSF